MIKGLKFFSLVLFTIVPINSLADCMQASNGQVFCGAGFCDLSDSGTVSCSLYKHGGAAVNTQGRVECGKGLCLQNNAGQVWCSSLEEGGASISSSGQVKCYGGCEPGSESMCESIRGE
jgi:hypothetical protein